MNKAVFFLICCLTIISCSEDREKKHAGFDKDLFANTTKNNELFHLTKRAGNGYDAEWAYKNSMIVAEVRRSRLIV